MNTPELSHLEYVLANLGRGVDPVSPADYLEKIKLIRQIALDHKMRLMILQPNQQFQQNLSQLWGQVQTQLAKPLDRTRLEEQTSLQKVLARSEAPALRAKLKDQNPQHRLMTVQTIGQRRIPLEAELIERLNDPEPMVRWAVYQALVRLARGADFGPRPNAGKVERARAVAKWRAWLALQEDAPKVNSVPPTEQEAEALKLCATFLQANPKDQLRMLDEWQGQEGEAITMALSGVLADLKSERQAKVRQTLTNRFAALANEAVAEFLTDDDPELRCAAARAPSTCSR